MESKKSTRILDEHGRIVLPAEARGALDWGEKTPVEIWVNATEHEIVIRQYVFRCIVCGATENLKSFGNRLHICSTCQNRIAKL